MTKRRKNCRKLLYKKCLKYKTNIQRQKNKKYKKFKKQKWTNFLGFLKRAHKRRKAFYKIYDITKYVLPKITEVYRKRYRNLLQNKQKTSFYYGGLKRKFWKQQLKTISNKKTFFTNSLLLDCLERRLDVILFRSHFVFSIKEARQLIKHRHIKINKSLVTKSSIKLKDNDIITINSSIIKKRLYNNIADSELWPLPPKYLIINYKTFEIMFLDQIKYHNFSMNFPDFLPNFYLFMQYMKYH
jgi:ribosomal protein S4